MALYGDELAAFNRYCDQMAPLCERLKKQNDAIGETLLSLSGIANALYAWAAAGHIEPGHFDRLVALVQPSIHAGKVAYMVEACNALGQLNPPLRLVTDASGEYTPVDPVPVGE